MYDMSEVSRLQLRCRVQMQLISQQSYAVLDISKAPFLMRPIGSFVRVVTVHEVQYLMETS